MSRKSPHRRRIRRKRRAGLTKVLFVRLPRSCQTALRDRFDREALTHLVRNWLVDLAKESCT
jgi:hypothetical protein